MKYILVACIALAGCGGDKDVAMKILTECKGKAAISYSVGPMGAQTSFSCEWETKK